MACRLAHKPPRATCSYRLLLGALVAALWPLSALAQAPSDDPYAYSLRAGVFPVFFQAGISQSLAGSALRAEADLSRRFTVHLAGRLGWATLAGQQAAMPAPSARAGVSWHFEDDATLERLAGVVHPADASVVRNPTAEAGWDPGIPVIQKLGGPELIPRDRDPTRQGRVRRVQSLRLFYDYVQSVQRARPADDDGNLRYSQNRGHLLSVGYSFGSHWNIRPQRSGETREVGYRRFYFDALVTHRELNHAEALETERTRSAEFLTLGARLGLEGALAGWLPSLTHGAGLAYILELAVLPGESGLEGRLFIALGAEIDS